MREAGAILGAPIDRVDGRLKVTGGAKYAAEFAPEGLVHAVAVQSTVAKGRVEAIDAAEARAMPGVIAVLTHENAPALQKLKVGDPKSGHAGEDLPPLSGDEIHFAGQYVALVVAEELPQARRAAYAVKVRYREEKPVLTIEDAEPTATYPKENNGRPVQHRRGDAAAALADPAAVRVEATYTLPVETHNPMELHATTAHWSGGALTVWDATQAVIGVRNALSTAFGLDKDKVHVICPFVGGGFGSKGAQWPHVFASAMAAKAVERPVRLVVSRAQMFQSVGHRPPIVQKMALAASRDGRLTAIRHETTTPTSPVSTFIEPCGRTTSALLYACENADIPQKLVRVNVAAPTFMRAPGEASGTFAIESAMDELAVALDMDPIALRVKNHADVNGTNQKPFSSKHLKECYARGAEKFGWDRRDRRPGSMTDGGTLVGWGMATALYPANRWEASALIRVSPDGTALVRAATQDLGTGAYTVLTQAAADALGIPVEKVRFELGDSSFPEAPVSGGSNTTASVSEAIVQTAAALRRQLGGSDADTSMSIAELVRRGGRTVEATATAKPPEEKDKKFDSHSFGAQFCEVRIDPLLPRVQVSRWVSVMNAGRVMNLKTGRSQIMGGIVMGIGMALLEHTVYDPRTGRPVTASLADYLVPVNADVGTIDVEFVGEPDPAINTLGCRGIGEIGITGAAAAVANAVYHATGKRVRDLPITPDKLL
ncbi:MAG TPA: xanthine dehydrogenase family protein molybdopterin-binding subunit [Thermoanaerobaculia bacterium]